MPTIELPDGQEAGAIRDSVLGTMLYPREEEKRHYWLAAARLARLEDLRKRGFDRDLSRFLCAAGDWVGELWKLKQGPEAIYDNGVDRLRRARLSGHVLFYLLRAASHHPEHCKLQRVKLVVSTLTKPEAEGYSESLIEKTWPEFSSVSHLWAAFWQFVKADSWDGFDSTAMRLLEVAEAYRQAAEASRLLDPSKTWKAPSHIDPAPIPAFLPFEEDILSLLTREFPNG